MGFSDTLYTILFHYSQFYFITLGVILGSGILGLPTTLADSGFQPFLITISASYIVQVLILLFLTEVLQKAYYRNVDKLQESNTDGVPIRVETYKLQTYGSQNDLVEKSANNTETIEQCLPNFYSLGELYLPCFLSYLFTLVLSARFTIYLATYACAGSQAFATLFGVSYYDVVSVFFWTWMLVIILLHSLISPIVTILTLFKGTLFTVTVFLTFAVGVQNPIPVVNDFSAIGDTFLMTLISLSGFQYAMPFMFPRVKRTRNGIIGFNIAIFLGLTTCLILNILWCWSVLAIVPQQSVCLPDNDTETIQMSLKLFGETQGQCVQSPSLENAAANGEIATVPLCIILQNEQNISAQYISILIQVLVAVSTSVSFILVGTVLYDTLNGIIYSFWSSPTASKISYGNIFKFITIQLIRQWFLSLIVFTVIFVITTSNPKGFNVFLEYFASFFVAIENGIFFAIMIHKATLSTEFSSYVLPFQLPRWLLPFQYIIPIYYICAIIYNIYTNIVFFSK